MLLLVSLLGLVLSNTALRVPAPATGSYTTSFPLTENPISEGGNWTQGSTVTAGSSYTNLRTGSGNAYAASTVSDGEGILNDSICCLNGSRAAWINMDVRATFFRSYTPSGVNHEWELHTRCSITSSGIYTYEHACSATGAFIVRWNGSPYGITYLSEVDLGSVPFDTGHQYRATCINDVDGYPILSTYQNTGSGWVLICQIKDNDIGGLPHIISGAPGMAFFARTGATLDGIAYSDFTASQV